MMIHIFLMIGELFIDKAVKKFISKAFN